MKLVVITGCLGLIGSYTTRKCLSKGWKVYGVDNLTYAANKSFLEAFKRDSNFTFLEENIAQLKTLPDCDYVINIAAYSNKLHFQRLTSLILHYKDQKTKIKKK